MNLGKCASMLVISPRENAVARFWLCSMATGSLISSSTASIALAWVHLLSQCFIAGICAAEHLNTFHSSMLSWLLEAEDANSAAQVDSTVRDSLAGLVRHT